MTQAIMVRPNPDEDFYVLWSLWHQTPLGYGNREEFTIIAGRESQYSQVEDYQADFEYADSKMFTNQGSTQGEAGVDIFPYDTESGSEFFYVAIENLYEWCQAFIADGGHSRRVLELSVPTNLRSIDMKYSFARRRKIMGYTPESLAHVESFFRAHIEPVLPYIRTTGGDVGGFEKFAREVKDYFPDEVVQWTSVIHTFGKMWIDYDHNSEEPDTSQYFGALASAVEGMTWEQSFVVFAMLDKGGFSFTFNDFDNFTAIRDIVVDNGWDAVEKFLPAIETGSNSYFIRECIENGVDSSLAIDVSAGRGN